MGPVDQINIEISSLDMCYEVLAYDVVTIKSMIDTEYNLHE